MKSNRAIGTALGLSLVLVCGLNPQVNGADRDTQTQSISTEVTTKGTEPSGKRNSDTSDWTKFTAPKGYVIVEKEVQKVIHSAAGSENRVDVEFEDYVELIPDTGIKQPRTIRVRSFARSPKNKIGARGWTKAEVIVRQVKYLN